MTVGIRAVAHRQVLNSHGEWTPELTLELADGRRGRGAAPRGETRRSTSAVTPQPKSRSRTSVPSCAGAVHPDLVGQGACGPPIHLGLRRGSLYPLRSSRQAVVVPAGLSSPTAVQRRQRRQLCPHQRRERRRRRSSSSFLLTDDVAASVDGYRRLDAGVRRELGGAPPHRRRSSSTTSEARQRTTGRLNW